MQEFKNIIFRMVNNSFPNCCLFYNEVYFQQIDHHD